MSGRSCQLCGLPCGKCPLSTSVENAERLFCCVGCMNVYLILAETGAIANGQDVRKTDVFKQALQLGLIARGDREEENHQSDASTATLDSSARDSDLVLQISGMWCSSCAWLIEHAVKALPGVRSVEASFATDLLKVQYQPQLLPPDRIVQRVAKFGYKATPFAPGTPRDSAEQLDLLLRFGLAAFFWLNIMTFSLAIYVGYFEHIADSVRHYMPFVLMTLATPVVFYCGWPLLRLFWLDFRNRTLRMESLVCLGVLAAYLYSVVQAFQGASRVYFDTASAIITFVLAGKLLERGAKDQTSRCVTLLQRMVPNKVRLLADGREYFVSAEALQSGQIFLVKAGEHFPADGTVEQGITHADESLVTGEATPVAKQPAAHVIAGSVNLDGVVHVKATETGRDCTLARIIALVERALSSRSELERTVDRVSRIFVPCVVGIAVLTFIVCWAAGFTSFGGALMRMISILVIACPCALGLATPLAITTAMGNASRRGILISDASILETLGAVNHVVLDKTGTMTEGKFELTGCELVTNHASLRLSSRTNATDCARDYWAAESTHASLSTSYEEVFELLASLEQYSEHPLGRATVSFARERKISLTEASCVEIHKGLGITGMVAERSVFVGGRWLLKRLAISVDAHSELVARRWESEGQTVAFFGWDGDVRGCLAFGDHPRRHASELVADLKQRGVTPHLVSGDSRATTEAIASQLGVEDFLAEVLPDQKARLIQEYRKREGAVVAMVGDGINDAPALAESHLGIAMGSGTDIAMRAASVVLMDNDLEKIPEVFDLARKTMRIVRQNLFWAFFYNTAGITLAVLGILNPIFAAVAMLLSSLSVVGNSLRIARSSSA